MFNQVWREGKIPKEWRRAVICPIHKKGDKKECGNYRGIALLVGASKIYEIILERRFRTAMEDKIGEWQHGFRPGKSTTDLIFYMKMLTEKTIEWDKKACDAFTDLEKAFDRINRERLWRVLEDQMYDIPERLIDNSCKNHVRRTCKYGQRRGRRKVVWSEDRSETGERVVSATFCTIYRRLSQKNMYKRRKRTHNGLCR